MAANIWDADKQFIQDNPVQLFQLSTYKLICLVKKMIILNRMRSKWFVVFI